MRGLVVFFALVFLATWTCFLSALMLPQNGAVPPAAVGMLVFAGTMMPALAALGMTVRAGGLSLSRQPLLGLLRWEVGARWYVFAIGYMTAIKLAVAVVHRVATGFWPSVSAQSLGIVIFAVIVSTPIQAGEEIGWRGYALPGLAERMGMARASLLLGAIWACWHLPLFFLHVPGNEEYGQSFPVWALSVTALSVAIAWLYMRTKGSLLLCMLMHSAVNNSPHFVQPVAADASRVFSLHASPVLWLSTAFLWFGAAYFLYRMRRIEACGDQVE